MSEAPYDRMAEEFAQDIASGARADFRRHVMYPSVLRAVGDVAGQTVLDLACGSGVYARLLRQRGASHVVGVDISAGMIDVARAVEANEQLGINYLVHDVAGLPVLGSFDLATAVTLFNFADSWRTLTDMYARIHSNLRPGGRLVALMQNSEFNARDTVIGQFGMHQRGHTDADGSTVLVDLGDPPQTVTTWCWRPATHERAAAMAGFGDLRWWPHICVAAAQHPHHAAFQRYLANPHMVIMSAKAEEPAR